MGIYIQYIKQNCGVSYDFSDRLTNYVHIDLFHACHGDEKTHKLSLLDCHLLSHGRKSSAITESSLLFVICLSAIKPLSVCQSSWNTTNKTIKSNILTWLTELGTVNDPRLTGYEIL